jgi:hypothetical protein
MATVVAIMDRPGWMADTDNIVIVDPEAERLLWVPRDLWCATIRDRVNTAFARGGHRGLVDALAEHGFVVHHSLCLARAAVEHALEHVEVTVPVDRELVFWYGLSPQQLLRDGRKVIRFRPPAETLRGERLHQWIGARSGLGWSSSDFDRIDRQQTLLRCGWHDLPFSRAVENADWVSVSGPEAYEDLRNARPSWRLDTFADVQPRTIGGSRVLVNRQGVSRARLLSWSISERVAALGRRARRARLASS